jgi:uncharacterized radical SAM superfamily Fe-S cluster-containing enzyme
MSEFATFQKYKEKEKQAMIERNSGKTLEIYNLIEEMLQNPDYESSETFLESVMDFIGDNNYVSVKQIEIVERIYRHPNGK